MNLSRRRANARRAAAATDAAIDTETAHQRAERAEAARTLAEAAKARENARQRFTAADLADATHIHDGISWRRVVRVNAKTVTVTTPHSWTDRLPLDQIHHHRTIKEDQ